MPYCNTEKDKLLQHSECVVGDSLLLATTTPFSRYNISYNTIQYVIAEEIGRCSSFAYLSEGGQMWTNNASVTFPFKREDRGFARQCIAGKGLLLARNAEDFASPLVADLNGILAH